MSETSARARRRAFWFGSFARNGLIGFLCTTAGARAGVDGVDNAADTLAVVVNAGGVAVPVGGAGGSGIADRGGGVRGAPNDAAIGDGAFLSGAGARVPDGAVRSEATRGGSSLRIAGACLGENGGVRWRGCADGSTGRGGTGATFDDGAAAARGGGAVRECGTGGGQAVDAVADAGVFVRERMGFTPFGVVPRAGAAEVDGETCRSSPQFTAAPTGMSPPQTEQRARIDTLVILAGSSRKTERHSGQDTFIGIAGWVASAGRPAAGPE